MTMFTHSTLVLVALVVVFALAKKLRLTTELSMLTATIAAVLIHLILPQGEDQMCIRDRAALCGLAYGIRRAGRTLHRPPAS